MLLIDLYEATDDYDYDDIKAAVGVVRNGDKWLLGLAKNTKDDRTGYWVFPGGHVKRNEKLKTTAEREVREETGIRCTAVGEPKVLDKPGVVFVLCRASGEQVLKPNSEFTALGFFTRREFKSLKLYHNVNKVIDKLT